MRIRTKRILDPNDYPMIVLPSSVVDVPFIGNGHSTVSHEKFDDPLPDIKKMLELVMEARREVRFPSKLAMSRYTFMGLWELNHNILPELLAFGVSVFVIDDEVGKPDVAYNLDWPKPKHDFLMPVLW